MDSVEKRPFGFWMATALVVGGMIGSGIFLMPVGLAPLGWTAVAAWGISIAGAVSLAFTMSRLAQAMPQASGVVAVTGAALGELVGVLVGWSYWVSVWSANAGISIAATSYLGSFVPWIRATPLNGAMTAIFTGFACARSMRHGIAVEVASVAAPSAPCLMIVRLVVMTSSLWFAASLSAHYIPR